MKKVKLLGAAVLCFAVIISLSGCNTVLSYFFKKPLNYSEKELVGAADLLFNTEFEVISSEISEDGKLTSYLLRSEDIPFDFSVYSQITSEGAHPWCDYYSCMMEYKRVDAAKIAKKYGFSVSFKGQEAYVSIENYNQLEQIYCYLDETNKLYEFKMEEAQLTGLLRDIRSRPTLSVSLDDKVFGQSNEIVLLYYTINNDTYFYKKDELLPAVQEKYIELIDRLKLTDNTVTDEIRGERVRPAITELRINGEPCKIKKCKGYILNPNITFDYNWGLRGYYGDIRICAPSNNYDAPPSSVGDDRNFKYLIELLGGTYSSALRTKYNDRLRAYSAHWFVGGKEYGGTTICTDYIPTESAFSSGEFSLSVDCTYSKEIWGLENGYGPEDYYVRLTPEALGTLLGVSVEADYDEGWLNLVTPEGYFDAAKPIEYPEQFLVEKVKSENSVVDDRSHYIIYKADGSILKEEYTEPYSFAYCYQLDKNIVQLKISDHGTPTSCFFNTETGEKSSEYQDIALVKYPLFVYHPGNSSLITVREILGEQRYIEFETDIYPFSGDIITNAEFSSDMKKVTVTYTANAEDYHTDTKTFDLGNTFAS